MRQVYSQTSAAILSGVLLLSGCTSILVRDDVKPVSYTHLRAHETVLDIVCRLLLEKKKTRKHDDDYQSNT